MRSGTPPLSNCGFRVLAPVHGDRDRGTEPPVRTYQFRGDADPSARRRCRLRGAVCDRCGCSKPGSSYGLLGSTRTGQRPRPLLTPSIVDHSTTPGNGHALVQVPFRSTGARHARCARALRPFSLIVSVAPPGPVAGGAERFVCMAETVAGACSGDINACAGPPAGPHTVAASAGGSARTSVSVCSQPPVIVPNSPCDSSSGPAVKNSVSGRPFEPALPNSSAHSPSIASFCPSLLLSVPRCSNPAGVSA